jgi:hypothetical protein
MDVDSVIVRRQGKLDWGYIYSQFKPLAELKEAPELVTQLRALEKKWRHRLSDCISSAGCDIRAAWD